MAAFSAIAQEPRFDELARLFEYDRSAPQNEKFGACVSRGNVKVCEYSYDSPDGGRVPGTLILPAGRGKHPLILFGHWMMTGSPMANRSEFLEEAVIMAQAGAMALLIDTPLVRPGFVADVDPLSGQGAQLALQMARDWRRGLDLLTSRKDVDSTRIAYVGHSFSAGVGAKLTGVEKRIRFFVLMANLYSLRELVFDPDNAEMLGMRKRLGDDRVEAYLRKFPWDDSIHFVRRSAPAAVFLQFGRTDKPIRESVARASFLHFNDPKEMKFYDAGHELNPQARLERVEWLRVRLSLSKPDAKSLRAIPALR